MTSVIESEWPELRPVQDEMKFICGLCDLCPAPAVNYYATSDGRGLVVCRRHDLLVHIAREVEL